MDNETSFLEAMRKQPENASLRLIFADWLDERGDPRGELLRLMDTLTQALEVANRASLEVRLRSLLAAGVQPPGPYFTNSIGMKFALIWPGTFLMGASEEEARNADSIRDETPHLVTITQGIYLGVHPVTQSQWHAVMGSDPSHFKGEENLPVESVSWEDCLEFLKRMGQQDGPTYRLPTEAEWEYACRGGTTTPFSFGETISADEANFDGRYPCKGGKDGIHRRKTTPVGIFPSNGWGLYDMHGNVSEWCVDFFGDYPKSAVVDPQGPEFGHPDVPDAGVTRGGCYNTMGAFVRSACRDIAGRSVRIDFVGVRAAMSLSPV